MLPFHQQNFLAVYYIFLFFSFFLLNPPHFKTFKTLIPAIFLKDLYHQHVYTPLEFRKTEKSADLQNISDRVRHSILLWRSAHTLWGRYLNDRTIQQMIDPTPGRRCKIKPGFL